MLMTYMVLIAPSAAALQKLVDTCYAYISQNGLQLNNGKSKFMAFKNELVKEFDAPQIYIGNHALSQHNRVNYIRMLIRDDCKDDDSMLVL